jgi:hypothetical protein
MSPRAHPASAGTLEFGAAWAGGRWATLRLSWTPPSFRAVRRDSSRGSRRLRKAALYIGRIHAGPIRRWTTAFCIRACHPQRANNTRRDGGYLRIAAEIRFAPRGLFPRRRRRALQTLKNDAISGQPFWFRTERTQQAYARRPALAPPSKKQNAPFQSGAFPILVLTQLRCEIPLNRRTSTPLPANFCLKAFIVGRIRTMVIGSRPWDGKPLPSRLHNRHGAGEFMQTKATSIFLRARISGWPRYPREKRLSRGGCTRYGARGGSAADRGPRTRLWAGTASVVPCQTSVSPIQITVKWARSGQPAAQTCVTALLIVLMDVVGVDMIPHDHA